MAPPSIVADLVDRFGSHSDSYHSDQYNEAQVREEFLNPLFEALGWDVYNRKGYAEAYKEVIHEAAIKVGGRTKAPDYCFRAGGGVRSFFVEAKKPSVDIRESAAPAYQLRRYAWSAKLPMSILTDFEEFAAYDCRIRPVQSDRASTARILYFKYTDYLDRWDDLAGRFSPEAIRKGALDKFVASQKIKKGTAEVDAAFLEEIESWRDTLARNIALRNPQLSQRDLNFAVQRTIDRLVFLRICEDRGIETYGTLQSLVNGASVYGRLVEIFQRADQRYNSGLFHFTPEKDRSEAPDELTLGLSIDDKPLKEILKNLYYPESRYEFSVFPAEILGQVYEQFLGKVIRLTSGHRAVVEDKPEVKKAGGVYYTPSYIVDYIVRHTVGKLLEGKERGEGRGEKGEGDPGTALGGGPGLCAGLPTGLAPAQASKLKILDPACGSGSFLIGAYQYLLDWHRDRYVEEDPEKHARGRNPRLYRAPGGDWRLTTTERKRILLNNVYGVDIDPQAVEVTKLSLVLKVLEGETGQGLSNQFRLFHERALPDLGANIKCGNSLIGPDFYQNRQKSLLDEDEILRINAFDWKAEFPEIFKGPNPGFDAVIGNPPYVRQEGVSASKQYFARTYGVYHGLADLYVYFYERALELLKNDAAIGFITSSKFIHSGYGGELRKFIGSHARLEELIDFGDTQLFEGATTYPAIVVASKATGQAAYGEFQYARLHGTGESLSKAVQENVRKVPLSAIVSENWILASCGGQELLGKVATDSVPLCSLAGRAQLGIKTSLNEAFVVGCDVAESLLQKTPRANEVVKPHGRGRDIEKWHASSNGTFLLCTRIALNIDDYPSVKEHLIAFEAKLRARYEVRRGDYDWWIIRQVADTAIFDNPKIVYPDLCSRRSFALNTDGMYPNNTVFCITSERSSLLAYLNSRLVWYWIQHNCPANRGGAYRLFNQYMDRLPVRKQVVDDAHLDELGARMVGLHRAVRRCRAAHERTALERQIEATDREIDRLVYGLYGLTEEEIRIVEESVGPA